MNRLALMLPLLLVATPLQAQRASARAQQLAAEFSKTKDVTKHKYGIAVRKYRETISAPWVTRNGGEYAGHYESSGDEGFRLDVALDASGRVSASGRDDRGEFRLTGARIAGGLLTGERLYSDGVRRPLEAVFLRRFDRTEEGAPFTTLLGLGYLGEPPAGSGFNGPMRYFLGKMQGQGR